MIERQTHIPVKVRYLCATNDRKSRVMMISLVTGDNLTIPFGLDYDSSEKVAQAWLESKGLVCTGLIQDHLQHETILLLDWNSENIDLLRSIKLWDC